MTLHASAVAELSGWTTPDAGQDQLRRAFLQRLADGPDAVRRTGEPTHLTAGAVVLNRSGTHVLLVLHGKVRLWMQPGGHTEAGDATLADAARREAVEETGVADLQPVGTGPVHLDRHRAPCGVEQHLDVRYLLLAADLATPAVSAESLDVRWWPVDALPADRAPDVPDLVAAALRILGHSAPE